MQLSKNSIDFYFPKLCKYFLCNIPLFQFRSKYLSFTEYVEYNILELAKRSTIFQRQKNSVPGKGIFVNIDSVR